jgi:TolA-binding protein
MPFGTNNEVASLREGAVARRIGCFLTAVVFLALAGCATTRYEEYGAPLETDEGPAGPQSTPMRTGQDSLALSRIAALEAQLAGRLEEVGASRNELASRVAALTEQVEQLRRQIQGLRESALTEKPAPRPEVPTPQRRPAGEAELGALYALALNEYHSRAFEQATARLQEIQALEPDGDLADNAQYWIGECLYATKDFRGALETFRGVFRYSKTEKDDDAQLKLGLCHLRLGEDETGLIELKRLVVDYPESEYLARAEELIRQVRHRLNTGQ